jgi:hypothetical protein
MEPVAVSGLLPDVLNLVSYIWAGMHVGAAITWAVMVRKNVTTNDILFCSSCMLMAVAGKLISSNFFID